MKNITRLTIAAGILLAVFISSCGGGGTSVISKTPSDVVKASVDDLKNQKFSNVITYFVRKDGVVFTKQDTAKMNGLCAMAFEQARKKQGIKETQVTEEIIGTDGNSATVKYKILYNDGSDSNSSAELKKVNGNWLMLIGN